MALLGSRTKVYPTRYIYNDDSLPFPSRFYSLAYEQFVTELRLMKEAFFFFFFAEEGNSRWTRLGNFSFPVVRMKGKNEFVVIIDGLRKVRIKMDALHFKDKFINNNILERMIEMVQKIICRSINNELNRIVIFFRSRK